MSQRFKHSSSQPEIKKGGQPPYLFLDSTQDIEGLKLAKLALANHKSNKFADERRDSQIRLADVVFIPIGYRLVSISAHSAACRPVVATHV